MKILIVVTAWLLVYVTPCSAQVPVGERLRLAWAAHRIEGDLDKADRGYRALVEDDSVFADVRARAAIGLAMVEEKRGRLADARALLQSVRAIRGASPRWQIVASREFFRIPDPAAERDPIAQLDRQVRSLEEEQARLDERAGVVDEDLERRRRLYSGLRDHVVDGGNGQESSGSAALDLLESLASELRETERHRRTVVAARLERARELHQQGQFFRALNEAKRVLKVDPANNGAEELRRRCQVALSDVAKSPESGSRPFEHDLVLDMTRRYEEARAHYQAGQVMAAIRGLDEILSWYAFSAEPISDSALTQMVRPAERLMRQCFEATDRPEVAARLSERTRELRRELEQASERLESRTRAIDETGEGIAVIRAVAPNEAAEFVAVEIARLRESAVTYDRNGDTAAAISAYEDLLAWWAWFPELRSGQAGNPLDVGAVAHRIDELRREGRATKRESERR